MDILTDILNSAGLHKSLLACNTFYTSWVMRFPCEKSMGFHTVVQGDIYIRSVKLKEPIRLSRGDIIMLKRGFEHDVATDLKAKIKATASIDLHRNTTSAEKNLATVLATVVSGCYQFQTEPIHPFFYEIPDIIIIRSEEILPHSPLAIAQQLLSAELTQSEQGSESVAKSLVDVQFNYILRDLIERKSKNAGAWSAILKDQHLSKAIASIHKNLSYNWSVEELAGVSGISRAAFSQKFKKITKDTPAHYIAKVRIQRAMNLLRTTNDSLEKIADTIGYHDSFVFSKAFKRIQGVSPRDFKKQLSGSQQ